MIYLTDITMMNFYLVNGFLQNIVYVLDYLIHIPYSTYHYTSYITIMIKYYNQHYDEKYYFI